MQTSVDRSPRQGATRPGTSRAAPGPPDPFYALTWRRVWGFVRRQPLSFVFLNAYLFFEYVRPQHIYSAIDSLPFAQWTLILCALSFLVEGRPVRRPWTVIDTALVIFTAILIASCFTAWSPVYALNRLRDYLIWLLIYLMITTIISDERRFIVFTIGFMLWSLKMSQHAVRSFAEGGFTFRSWGATGAPGWFHNSGEMAIQMCIFLPVSFYFYQGLKPWLSKRSSIFFALLPVTAVIAVLSSSSRGGQMAGALVVLLMALVSRHRARAVMWLGALALLVAMLMPPEQWDRFSGMGDDKTSVLRLTYWRHGREIMSQYPVLGIGYENWLPYYWTHYNPDGELPHNIFIEAGAEMGYLGLAALIGLILATWRLNHLTRRLAKKLGEAGWFARNMALGLDLALVGFLGGGFFVTVLFYPFLWINLAFTGALYGTVLRKSSEARRQRAVQVNAGGTGGARRAVYPVPAPAPLSGSPS